jgi:hypothetical protein
MVAAPEYLEVAVVVGTQLSQLGLDEGHLAATRRGTLGVRHLASLDFLFVFPCPFLSPFLFLCVYERDHVELL